MHSCTGLDYIGFQDGVTMLGSDAVIKTRQRINDTFYNPYTYNDLSSGRGEHIGQNLNTVNACKNIINFLRHRRELTHQGKVFGCCY